MEKYVVKEISKNLKLYEKIIVRIFKKQFVRVYKLGINFGFNNK